MWNREATLRISRGPWKASGWVIPKKKKESWGDNYVVLEVDVVQTAEIIVIFFFA